MTTVARGMTTARWMSLSFAVGSLCFVVGPFPGYAKLVGGEADAATFFVGSIFFTLGGALQTALADVARRGVLPRVRGRNALRRRSRDGSRGGGARRRDDCGVAGPWVRSSRSR